MLKGRYINIWNEWMNTEMSLFVVLLHPMVLVKNHNSHFNVNPWFENALWVIFYPTPDGGLKIKTGYACIRINCFSFSDLITSLAAFMLDMVPVVKIRSYFAEPATGWYYIFSCVATLCQYKDDQRRPPLLTSLLTGTIRVLVSGAFTWWEIEWTVQRQLWHHMSLT